MKHDLKKLANLSEQYIGVPVEIAVQTKNYWRQFRLVDSENGSRASFAEDFGKLMLSENTIWDYTTVGRRALAVAKVIGSVPFGTQQQVRVSQRRASQEDESDSSSSVFIAYN